MKDKIIEILKEETHDANPYTGDDYKQHEVRKQGREIKLAIIATRIDSLYSTEISEEEIEKHLSKMRHTSNYGDNSDFASYYHEDDVIATLKELNK